MAASDFYWVESNGSGNTLTPAGPPFSESLSRADFLSIDESSHTDANNYKNHPIIVPPSGTSYSFEKWIRAYFKFNGSNQITNVKFWKSSGSLSDAALAIKFGVSTSFATPVNTVSSTATSSVPVAEPGSQNITLNNGSNTLTSNGFTDYIVLQLAVPSTVVTPGDIGSQEFTMQYDES